MDRFDGDVEFFEVGPDGSDEGDDALDVVDSARPPAGRFGSRLVGLAAGIGVAVLVVGSLVAHRGHQPKARPPGPAVGTQVPTPTALPSWVDVFGLSPLGPSGVQTPAPADHCPPGSVSMRMAATSQLVAALNRHVAGFVVDQATRIVNQQGVLCAAYLQAHDGNGVELWLAVTAAASDSGSSIAQLDYGPAAAQVHSVTVTNPDRSTVSVLARGGDPTLPASGDLTRLASDPAVLS